LKNPKLKIFCDFDGTLTKNDVWVNSLGKFIKDRNKFDNLCNLFNNLQITAKQCLVRELELVDNFDFNKFNDYLDKEELDDYAKNFLDYCKENNFDVFIISEGLDYYINYILKKENIELKVYCNKLITETGPDGKIIRLKCIFPYSDENCEWCGMSKRNVLISNTNDLDNEISVFIGDGTSDCCIANYADIVFAKKSLASYCWKNNITYFEYTNFQDVIKKIDKLIEQKSIKQRQISKTKRKDVLLGG
jgi:2-hydroxy-3-keto-5-methylthiopentenyl-1-phosphate phosphatase